MFVAVLKHNRIVFGENACLDGLAKKIPLLTFPVDFSTGVVGVIFNLGKLKKLR